MSVQILIDMNLSPDWVDELTASGWPSVHWSTVGDPRAAGPSVIQVRCQNVLPEYLATIVMAALKQHDTDLSAGAIVVVDEAKCRVRVLPI